MIFEYVRDLWVCVTFDMSKQSMLAFCASFVRTCLLLSVFGNFGLGMINLTAFFLINQTVLF